MKKKIISLVAVVALVVTTVAGTTLAYFNDKDDTANTFTMGRVEIALHESDRDGNKDEDYRRVLATKKMTPIVIKENESAFDAKGFIDKMIAVENKGTIDAYVRVLMAVPVIKGADKGPMNSENWLLWDIKTEDWQWQTSTGEYNQSEVVEIDGKDYRIYTATYKDVVYPGDYTSRATNGFYLNSKIDCEKTENGFNYYMMNGKDKVNLGDIRSFDVLVCAQSVQSRGFEDAISAFEQSGVPENPWS